MATHALHGQSRINPFTLAALRAAQPQRINSPIQGLAQLAQVIALQRFGRREGERREAGRKAENNALAAILAAGPGRQVAGSGASAANGGQAELAELLSGISDPGARRSLAGMMLNQRAARATREGKRLDREASAEQKRLDRENRLEIAQIRSGATPAQQSNNLEIANARQSVARTIEQFAKANELGTDEAVGTALTRLYATADELGILDNPDHNPVFRQLVNRAIGRKVGDDPGFERFQSFVTGSIPAIGRFPTFGQPSGAATVAAGPGARGAMPLPELTAALNQGLGGTAQASPGLPLLPVPAPRQAALPSQQPLAGAGRAAAAVPVSALRGPIAARAPTNVLPPGQQPLPLPGSGAFGAAGPLGTPAPAVPPVTRTMALQPSSTAALRETTDRARQAADGAPQEIPGSFDISAVVRDAKTAIAQAQASGKPRRVAFVFEEIRRRLQANGLARPEILEQIFNR